MTEERKYAILFAARLLCARRLNQLDSDRPSPARVAAVGMKRLLWSNEFRGVDSSSSSAASCLVPAA